jgi:RNA polymerase sigma-70 factor (ECF subfamily)
MAAHQTVIDPSPPAARHVAVSVPEASGGGGTAMDHAPLSIDRHGRAGESSAWVQALSGSGVRRDEAVARLHGLLERAARFELTRRGGGRSGDLENLATEVADDALMAIMRKLPSYRGDSRFTTWAYKFALLEAAVKMRRRTWQAREIPLDGDGWERLVDRRVSPGAEVETAELIDAVRSGIAEALTPHQRAVLVALTLDDVPLDVLADRLATTRGALYKTLHDARRKLRAHLAATGLEPGVAPDGGRT